LFGLECHLLSAHFDELLDQSNGPRNCPCCHAQFLRTEVLIRHLVQQHPDYLTNTLLSADDGGARHINCRFCGKQFLARHRKLLMLHIEQSHVADVDGMLNMSTNPLSGSLSHPSSSSGHFSMSCDGCTHDLDEDYQFLQASPVPRPPTLTTPESPSPMRARRSLKFNESDPQEHHYYDILDNSKEKDEEADDEKENNGKRGRASDDEDVEHKQKSITMSKIKQVLKKLNLNPNLW
jgi:hypothetical protein